MRLVRADRSEDAYARFCEKYEFEQGSNESYEAFGLRCAEIDAFNEIDGDDEPEPDEHRLVEFDEPVEPVEPDKPFDELPF